MATRNHGPRHERHRADELLVLPHLQRSDHIRSHVLHLTREWNDDLVDVLFVARLTDGEHKGKLHIYDGGTRHLVKTVEHEDHAYTFDCWVTAMTEREAAERFLGKNERSKKPGAFDRYKVGCVVGRPDWLAVRDGLAKHNVVIDTGTSSWGSNGEPGKLKAVESAHRIVDLGFKRDGSWDAAAETLAWVIGVSREAYANSDAHDADLIQGIARIEAWNPEKVRLPQQRAALVRTVGTLPVAAWRQKAMELRGLERFTYGGSASRATHMANVIVVSHNRSKRGGNKLFSPSLARFGEIAA